MQENKDKNDLEYNIPNDIDKSFSDVKEFRHNDSLAVREFVRTLDVDSDVKLACDPKLDEDDPYIVISVIQSDESVAVVMRPIKQPDIVFLDDVETVYPALRELYERDYCWIVSDPDGIADTLIKNNPRK